MPIKHLLEWAGFKVIWECGTDSSAAKGMAMREGVGKVRHLDCRALWTQHAAKQLGLKIIKLVGKHNCADLGTKSHTSDERERLMRLAGIVHAEGLDAPIVDVLNIESRLLPRLSNTSLPEDGRSVLCRVIALLLEIGGSLIAASHTDD